MPKISTFATPEQLTGMAYTNITGTFRRNLSAAAWMDYTSPATAQMSEPRTGASCWAVAEISECNSYMSQHLDSRPVLVILIYSMSEPGTDALQMRVSETGRHTIISECITS